MQKIKICLIIFFIFFMTSCSRHEENRQGYVDADYTYISAQFSGVLKKLFVARGDVVKANQPLFILEPQPESQNLESAKAALQQAIDQRDHTQARLDYANLLLHRKQKLLEKKDISIDEVDAAQTNVMVFEAELKAREADITAQQANLANAEWRYSKKTMPSPVAGFVYDTYFTEGELVQAGQAVLALLAPNELKIIFYIPEGMLGRVHLGDMVEVTCDDCKSPVKAKINYISSKAEYTPPIIYSENSRKKFTYRIEAKPLSSEPPYQLHTGQPVTVNLANES